MAAPGVCCAGKGGFPSEKGKDGDAGNCLRGKAYGWRGDVFLRFSCPRPKVMNSHSSRPL